MFWVFATLTHASIVEASRLVRVTCEKCGARYGYEMLRCGRGRATTPYGLFAPENRQRAGKIADTRAQELLDSACDPVPCPACGWYQSCMVNALRERNVPWTPWSDRDPANPNCDFPQKTYLTPGAPEGFLIEPPPNADGIPVPPLTENLLPPVEPGDWVTVRTSRLILPPVCCICMAPQTATLPSDQGFQAPVCDACLARCLRSQRLRTLIGAAIVGGIVTGGTLLYLANGFFTRQNIPSIELLALAFLACLMATLLGGYLGRASTPKPVVVGEINIETETARLSFCNTDFRDALRTHMAQARAAYIAAAQDQLHREQAATTQ